MGHIFLKSFLNKCLFVQLIFHCFFSSLSFSLLLLHLTAFSFSIMSPLCLLLQLSSLLLILVLSETSYLFPIHVLLLHHIHFLAISLQQVSCATKFSASDSGLTVINKLPTVLKQRAKTLRQQIPMDDIEGNSSLYNFPLFFSFSLSLLRLGC